MRKARRFTSGFLCFAIIASIFAVVVNTFVSAEEPLEDIIIDTDTIWEAGNYTYGNVLVTNNSTLVFNGAVNLTATDITIDSGSSISADGKGYDIGTGPGAGSRGTGPGGGGYGGVGGYGSSSGLGGGTYGSVIEPLDLGSGGATALHIPAKGGAGGGAIRLTVFGTLTVNGSLTANGNDGLSTHTSGGGGSGGSIYITTSALIGDGTISANGGSSPPSTYPGGGGGGGRIAIYYDEKDFIGSLSAYGGSGYIAGGAGTIFTKSSNQVSGDLLIDNYGRSGPSTPVSTLDIFDKLTISNHGDLDLKSLVSLTVEEVKLNEGGVIHVPTIVTVNNLEMGSGTQLNHPAGDVVLMTLINDLFIPDAASITANIDLNLLGNLTIDDGGSISADDKGYDIGTGPGAGSRGTGPGGGGYGGVGGYGSSSGLGGGTYGSVIEPLDLGSGGATALHIPAKGGAGGGAIRLTVFGTLTVNGSLTANGNDGLSTYTSGGGGSGGSIYITTSALIGDGTISANGGSSPHSTYPGGGGGGGRIAIYYDEKDFIGSLSAYGGSGYIAGGAGTIFTKSSNQVSGDLLIDNCGRSGSLTPESILNTIDTLTVTNQGKLDITGMSSLTAERINIVNGGIIYSPTMVTASSLWMGSEAQISHQAEEAVVMTIGSDLIIPDTASITAVLNMTVLGSMVIESNGSISTNSMGYDHESGPGAGSKAWSGGGGGYGGAGGDGAGLGGGTYGSLTEPFELGSGGGGSYYMPGRGGAGGGAIRLIVTGMLTVNGSLTANGSNGIQAGGGGGGGSGGSIYILARTLRGNGIISANGGNSGSNIYAGGGGGGRIAIYYQNSTFTGNIEAKGGLGINNGENGTVNIQIPSINFPITCSELLEVTSNQSTLTEELVSRKATLTNVTVTGDLNGTLNFTNFEIITIQSGSFKGKGFSKGEWQANLEGLIYEGKWEGMFFLNPTERRIYLKGAVSGEISGIVEGECTESVQNSNVFDQYHAYWRVNRIGTDLVSGTIDLNGTINYQEILEYPYTKLHALQTYIEGTTIGHYTGPLSTVLTHIRIVDESNPYYGEGFSIISYISNSGQGEGWTYDKLISPSILEMSGLFTDPLLGIVSGTLVEIESTRNLYITIKRIDLGLLPAPDLKVRVWGPERVSPGQTVNYIIEYRNDGVKIAENVTVTIWPTSFSNFISSSSGAIYNNSFHAVSWNISDIPPKTVGFLSIKIRLVWGLPNQIQLYNQFGIHASPEILLPPEELYEKLFEKEQSKRVREIGYIIVDLPFELIDKIPSPIKIYVQDYLMGGIKVMAPLMNMWELKRWVDGKLWKARNEYNRKEEDYWFRVKWYLQPLQKIEQIKLEEFVKIERNSGYSIEISSNIFETIQARDPNIKYGPEGNVTRGQTLNYKVEYENEGEGIAFGVYFTDTLDVNLNDSTLEIGPVLDVKTGQQIGEPGTYNQGTRTITWFVGEVGPGEGGYANFSVNVRNDASDGSEIINFATVYFPSVPEATRTNGIVSIVRLNQPPVAETGGPYEGNEGSPITFDASSSTDPDEDELEYRWDFDNDGVWDTEYSSDPTTTHTWYDDHSSMVIVEVSDGTDTSTDSATVTVNNVAPTITLMDCPADPVPVTSPVYMNCEFTDPGDLDTHSAMIEWGDGNMDILESVTSPIPQQTHQYEQPGVYKITIVIEDDNGGNCIREFRYAVVYDPDGGFVTGGGWIDSPSGAYTPDPTLTGKASFGFVAKYKKGTTEPMGNTEFQFHAANMNFHSNEYEWLVVAGSKAMFKGTGTINGQGEYKFILTAVDGDLKGKGDNPDRFRIKIWIEDEATAEEIIIYDNMLGAEIDEELGETTVLGGGEIVIHNR